MRLVTCAIVVACVAAAISAAGETKGPSGFDVLNGRGRLYKPNNELGTSLAVSVDAMPLAHTAQVLPLDSAGKIVGGDKAGAQTAAALENLDQVLRAAGSSLQQVVKLNVYVARLEDMAGVQNQIAAVFHREMKPAACFVITPL